MNASKKGRKPTIVNAIDLQAAINSVETNGPFDNRGHLYEAIASTEFAKTTEPRPLTAQAIMLLIKKHSLVVKTPLGKRGNPDALRSAPRVSRKARKPMPTDNAAALKKSFAEPQYQKTVEKALAGNVRALVKLKCLDCCCKQPKEISLCTSFGCPLWSIRPYQGYTNKTQEISFEDSEDGSAAEFIPSV